MKKIVLISFSNLPNFQSSLYNTYKTMKNLGVEVYTIGSTNITANRIYIENNNYLINVSKNPMPTIESLRLINTEIDNAVSKIKDINPDYIHFISKHTWNYFLIRKLKKYNIKMIHTFHDPIGHKGEIRRYGVLLYNKVIGKMVDKIIVHSDKSKYETERYIKPRGKIYKVPLGEMIWEDYKKNEQYKNKLLIFGRINPYKGVEFIPKIAKEINKINPNINIVIAGKTSNDVKLETINEISSIDNIKFINKFIDDSDVENYFNDCDIVLITHKSITQSGVILQAYRYSKPIVAFNIEGIHEFVQENKTGLISEAYNIEKYVKNILSLYNNINELNNYSKSAWEFGKEKFSNEVMSKKLIEIYMDEEKK